MTGAARSRRGKKGGNKREIRIRIRCSTCMRIAWKRASPCKHNVELSTCLPWRTRTPHPTFPRKDPGWFTSRFQPLRSGQGRSRCSHLHSLLSRSVLTYTMKSIRTFRSYRRFIFLLVPLARFYYISVNVFVSISYTHGLRKFNSLSISSIH